jgi:hypothetical protein
MIFSRFTFITGGLLALTLAVLSLGLMGISSRLPSGQPDLLASNPCLLPCILGVTPGQTRRPEAEALVQQLAFDEQSFSAGGSGDLLFRLLDGNHLTLLGAITFDYADPTLVSSVSLSTLDSRAQLWRLGDVMAAGLNPRYVLRSCDTQLTRMLIVFGEEWPVLAEFRLGTALKPETPLDSLRVSMPGDNFIPSARINFGCSVETGWRGFLPAWAYLE